MHNYNFRDVDETVQWIVEKDNVLSSDDYGKDLASVNALKRKHDGVERDLVALDDKVQNLGNECDQLKEKHPEVAEDIEAKKIELLQAWSGLKDKASLFEQFFMMKFSFQ